MLLMALATTLLCGPVKAQSQSPTTPTDPDAPKDTSQATQDQSNNPNEGSTPTVQEIPPAFQVTKLGSAQWLEPNVHSLLHLGPLYVASVSGIFVASDAEEFSPAQNQTTSGLDYFGVLRTDVIYDKLTKEGRFTFQYLPEVAIDNGVVQTNFSNQSLTFALARSLGPRWTIGVNNTLSYINGHVLYGDLGLDVNSVTGTGVQSPFLQTTQRWLNDSSGVNLGYQLSARSQLSFAANFSYSDSNLSTLPEQNYIYGGTFGWSHSLSPTKSVGLYAQLEESEYSSMFSSTLYKGFGGNFTDRLSPTLVMSASGGISLGNSGEAAGQHKQFNVTGTGILGIRKDFQGSSIALDANRGITTGPFVTNGYTSRVDATYSRHFGLRLSANVGGAYEQDRYSGGTISGTYVTVTMDYILSRNVSWFNAYSRRWQDQSQTILGSGQIPSNTFATGITWNLVRSSNVISPVIY